MTDRDIFCKFMEAVAKNAGTIYDAHVIDNRKLQTKAIEVLACGWTVRQLTEEFGELDENNLAYLIECATALSYLCNFINGKSEEIRMEQRQKRAEEKGTLTKIDSTQ